MIDPDLKAVVIPRSPQRGGVRMWHVGLLLDPDYDSGRAHKASWLPADGNTPASVYSVVIDHLNVDVFPESDMISVEHTTARIPEGQAVIGTEIVAPAPTRYKTSSGMALAATYCFPS